MIKRALLPAALVATPLAAQEPSAPHPADEVSPQRLKADVEKLVSFGTRHTLSSQTDPKRGIGAAVDWGLEEFRRIGAKCGGCLEVLPVGEVIQPDGRRIPTATLVRNAVAIQRGTERPNEVIIVQGHIDGTATVLAETPGSAWRVIRFSLAPELAPLVARKGSIAVDGVSLTVSEVSDVADAADPTGQWFEVSLIPETLAVTTLGTKTVGSAVNIETDILARHVARLHQFEGARS